MKDNPSHRLYSSFPSSGVEAEDLIDDPHLWRFWINATVLLMQHCNATFPMYITDQLIGEAIHGKRLDPKDGALLSFSDFKYFLIGQEDEESIAALRWNIFPFEFDLSSYRLFSALTAWRFTETVVTTPPFFHPGRDLHWNVIESIPLDLFYSLHGLPLYIPVKSKEFWGVLVEMSPKLSTEEVLNIDPEAFSEKPACKGLQFFMVNFVLVRKKPSYENRKYFDCFCYLTSKKYLNQEAQELDRLNGVIPISMLEKELSKQDISPSMRRSCMDAIKTVIYFAKNLPSPDWIANKKTVRFGENRITGSLIARPSATFNIVFLTPDGCIDVSEL